jgi:hypothetical protein
MLTAAGGLRRTRGLEETDLLQNSSRLLFGLALPIFWAASEQFKEHCYATRVDKQL